MTHNLNTYNPLGVIGAAWGLIGFTWLILAALKGLAFISFSAIQAGLTQIQWFFLTANVLFMAYSEGYKGFQKSYSPRLAARVKYLAQSRNPLQIVLAPFFCMGFFHAPRKRMLISYCLLIGIVILVWLFRQLPQPWRGILDAGVVVGLCWGMMATLWFCLKEFFDRSYNGDPEIV